MWQATNTETVKATPEDVWKSWTDVENWPEQDKSLESSGVDGLFEPGTIISLKPKGSPKVKVKLVEVTQNQSFSSVGKLPLAQLRFDHHVKTTQNGTEFTQSVTIDGPLAGLFSRLMGEKMARNLEARMKNVVLSLEQQGFRKINE